MVRLGRNPSRTVSEVAHLRERLVRLRKRLRPLLLEAATRLIATAICATMLIVSGDIPVAAAAAAGFCRGNSNQTVRALDRLYRRDEFRIVYTTQGVDAVASTVDRNGNGTPDQVEDIATQLVAARRIYTDIVGLKRPLDMPRYAEARSIDVFLSDMDKRNGLAYDEVVNHRLRFDGPKGRCTLRIDLGSGLKTQNMTPAHELFHLYQYGYSPFKMPWFLEGTARWAEFALRPGAGPQQPLPTTGEAVQAQLLAQKGRAGGVWNRLTRIVDPVGRISLPPDLAKAIYLDGSAVVHDDELHGAVFMKALLEELGTQAGRVSARRGWDRYNWEEADQKSSEYDKQVLKAVTQVLSRHVAGKSSRVGELQGFFDAASEMTRAKH